MKRLFMALVTAFSLLLSFPVYASNNEAFTALSEARGKTHSAGPFRLRGEETSTKESVADGKTSSVATLYQLSGYDYLASETYLQIVPQGADNKPINVSAESFLITLGSIYTKDGQPSAKWAQQDLLVLLPKLAALGTLDQFFMLELLNGDRLNLYAQYMAFAPDAEIYGETYKVINVKLSRAQFKELVETLTSDVKALLGPAAEGMTETQLNILQTFAKGLLLSLDAEMTFRFHIDMNGKILRVISNANMADPLGSAGARIKTKADIQFFDFGKEVTRIIP